jgi:hypothetical protein
MRRVHTLPTSARSAAIDALRPHRLVALAVTLLFVAAQALGLAHLAHVRHAPCVEHGGMRHLEDAHGETRAPSVDAAPALGGGPLAGASDAEEADHGHEDCSTCAREREPGLPGLSLTVPRPAFALLPGLDARPTGRTDVDGSQRWRLAPKQGPPTLG